MRHHAPSKDPRDPAVRHVAYVEVDPWSINRGGTTRTAACVCGWRGPERCTLDLAADDALTHERPPQEDP